MAESTSSELSAFAVTDSVPSTCCGVLDTSLMFTLCFFYTGISSVAMVPLAPKIVCVMILRFRIVFISKAKLRHNCLLPL